MEKTKRIPQGSPFINRLQHPNNNGELDLCADISEQPMAVIAYERSFNDYCVNCDKQPCACHLIPTI